MGDSYRLVTILSRFFCDGRPSSSDSCGKVEFRGVEVGVYRGDTSALLLREFKGLSLVMVDSWATYEPTHPYRVSGDGCARLTEAQQIQNMQLANQNTAFAQGRRVIYRNESLQAARNLKGQKFDFVFLDDDHTYEGVSGGIKAWWPLVRDGGLLCGHDIDHPRDVRGIWGVRRSVEEFQETSGVSFATLGSCWWFCKPKVTHDVVRSGKA